MTLCVVQAQHSPMCFLLHEAVISDFPLQLTDEYDEKENVL